MKRLLGIFMHFKTRYLHAFQNLVSNVVSLFFPIQQLRKNTGQIGIITDQPWKGKGKDHDLFYGADLSQIGNNSVCQRMFRELCLENRFYFFNIVFISCIHCTCTICLYIVTTMWTLVYRWFDNLPTIIYKLRYPRLRTILLKRRYLN